MPILGDIPVSKADSHQNSSVLPEHPVSPSYSSSSGEVKDSYRKRLLREYSKIPDHTSLYDVTLGRCVGRCVCVFVCK